jgi:hypothetical protein
MRISTSMFNVVQFIIISFILILFLMAICDDDVIAVVDVVDVGRASSVINDAIDDDSEDDDTLVSLHTG